MEGAQRTTTSLIDREERTVAALLTRFRALVTLAAEPVQDGATKEVAAAHGLQMEVEGSALVRATEDLLQLTRELKELWLFGPLRGINEGEGEGQMNVDSQKVGELVEAVLKRVGEHPPAS
ncbi:mediator complex, subunit Med22 [Leptodontidium sp. 2 PMI_412]|nr:mediator complex, subunit Med22 [Leptodontidium sp. 2 PMI_412]